MDDKDELTLQLQRNRPKYQMYQQTVFIMKKRLVVLCLIPAFCVLCLQIATGQTVDPLQPVRTVIGSGSSPGITDGNLTFSGTIGQTVVGLSEGRRAKIYHGFWHPAGKTTAVAGLRPTENNALLWNAPNPFTEKTTISYRLPVESSVQLKVYDLSGRLMSLLVDEVIPEGTHQVMWNGVDESGEEVATGDYIYSLHGEALERERTSIELYGVMRIIQ